MPDPEIKPQAIHEVFDVSVLFDTPASARRAWTAIFKTDQASCRLTFPGLNGFALLGEQPMPASTLDCRLLGDGFSLGEAYVGLTLGVLSQLELRQMGTDPLTGHSDYPDPWAEDGRLRIASLLLCDLLALGGHAVVLHKAAAVVKPAALFRYELGDPRDPTVCPYLAWLDTIASVSDGRLEARCYGMPHYYGAPNLQAVAQAADPFSVERAMQAVKYACGRIAAGNEDPYAASWQVPLWFVPGRRPPQDAAPAECLTWAATRDDDPLLVELRSDEVGARHPARLWNAEKAQPGRLPFELYARALADLVARGPYAKGLSLRPSPRFDAPKLPPVRVLCFEGPALALYVTAGFGRVAAPQGTDSAASAHAEFCLYGPPGEALAQRYERVLLDLGRVAFTTTVTGGLKDWDGLPPAPHGWGTLMVPMDDLALSAERPIALRMAMPVTSDETAAFRAGRKRNEWYAATVASAGAVASRWATALG